MHNNNQFLFSLLLTLLCLGGSLLFFTACNEFTDDSNDKSTGEETTTMPEEEEDDGEDGPEETEFGPDLIATTCSVSDTFSVTSTGTILDSTMLGVTIGTVIADSSSVRLTDGRIRKYFTLGGVGMMSAISEDGITFTVESTDPLIAVPNVSHQKVIPLEENTIKLFTSTDMDGGIISYTAEDGITFLKDDGVRILASDTTFGSLSHLTVVEISGGYRGYFSDLPLHVEEEDEEEDEMPTLDLEQHFIMSATSNDLDTWSLESGFRIGFSSNSITSSAEQPHALARLDDCVTVFYNNNENREIHYATAQDGVSFNQEFQLGVAGNGPDIVQLEDGTYILYYDTGDETSGFRIDYGMLSLDSP